MALLRVKRRIHEDPVDSLLLACKKPRTEQSSERPFSSLFQFAATVVEKDKDKDIQSHVKIVKENCGGSSLYKKRQVTDITDKLRAENKLFSENNRLKVINCFRHGKSGEPEKELTVIDVENQPHSTSEAPKDSHSSEEQTRTTDEQYVYDLYYSHEGDFDEIQMEHLLSAHAVDELLLDMNPPNEDAEDLVMDDEDDSNDEDNWRNDYPEESSDDSSQEENHLRLAARMRNFSLDGEYKSDLSSDREDEALIYGEEHRGEYYCSSFSDSSSGCGD